MLQLTAFDWNLNLRATDHPEFDAWRWNQYWVPLESVIEFKRDVYRLALIELSKHIQRRKNATQTQTKAQAETKPQTKAQENAKPQTKAQAEP